MRARASNARGRSPGRPADAAGARGRQPADAPGAAAALRSCVFRLAIGVPCARRARSRRWIRAWAVRGAGMRMVQGVCGPVCAAEHRRGHVSRTCARDGACALRASRAGNAARVAWMAVVFHLLAFASVFDIYFRSPIVNGMAQTPQPPGHAVRLCSSARAHARMHAAGRQAGTHACTHAHTIHAS